MRLKFIKDEDFVNYKKASMFLGTITCSFKCCIELNLPCTICQNEPWFNQPITNKDDAEIVKRFMANPFTTAVVIGGLEPLDQLEELIDLIKEFRKKTEADIVIYTGYREDEIKDQISQLKQFPNIILKVGRYVPNAPSHFDEVLGVTLASDNQYAIKIS